MIDQEEINTLKQTVNLVGVIRSCGIDLKKSGKSYKGFCRFHEDTKSPSLSITPAENLWQCFGCGQGGDVIDFIRKHDGISFKEAVARLSGGKASNLQKTPVKKKTELTPAHYKLLKRVAAFYHTAFNEDPRAMEYLIDRGITNKQLFTDHQIGFANDTLLNVLPDDGETINRLKELGILNQKGKEHFYGCAVFPLCDCNNNPVGMYGRRIPEFDVFICRVARDDVLSFRNNNEWLEHHPADALLFREVESCWDALKAVYISDFSGLVYGELPGEQLIVSGDLKMCSSRRFENV